MSAARGDPVRSAETAVVSFLQPSWFVRQPQPDPTAINCCREVVVRHAPAHHPPRARRYILV
jgi:hypothetical protein